MRVRINLTVVVDNLCTQEDLDDMDMTLFEFVEMLYDSEGLFFDNPSLVSEHAEEEE